MRRWLVVSEKLTDSTIMIIDDTPANLKLLHRMLRDLGFKVASFSRGAVALKGAKLNPPDLILLDISMPEMDGYTFLQTLTNNTSLTPVVIVCSNLTEQTDIDRALSHGAHFYLRKSDYIGDELVKAVQAAYDSVKNSHPQTAV